MSRNNKDRVGVSDLHTGAEAPPTPPQHQSSSPLTFVAPTEFVELPSGGRYYDEGHPLHNQDVIEIKHMTTKEEDILTSQALLKQGKALDRFLQQVIVDSRIDADQLLVGDKNAILVAARKTGYGAEYETAIPCPACGSVVQHEFDLDNASMVGDAEHEGVSRTDNNTFLIESLPTTKWSVEVKLLTSADERAVLDSVAARRKRGLPDDTLVTQMSAFTVSIEGVTNRSQINQAVAVLPAKDARYLRDVYRKLIPNIDLKQVFACSECDYSGDMEVPFTTDFFWPKQ